MDELNLLIDQGVAYEDQLVMTYFKVLRDEGFMDLFGTHKEDAKGLLTAMIDESNGHREGLLKLKESLK